VGFQKPPDRGSTARRIQRAVAAENQDDAPALGFGWAKIGCPVSLPAQQQVRKRWYFGALSMADCLSSERNATSSISVKLLRTLERRAPARPVAVQFHAPSGEAVLGAPVHDLRSALGIPVTINQDHLRLSLVLPAQMW